MNDTLRVVRVLEGTSVDGPGLRTSIYLAGCRHRCPGCHNPQTWDFQAGSDMDVESLMEIIRYNGFPVTFSGGDPLYQAHALASLAEAVKSEGLNIWCYTGFVYEDIAYCANKDFDRLLSFVDVLVDGPYIETLRNPDLLFRGSANQRLIDVCASRRQGKIVLFEPDISVL